MSRKQLLRLVIVLVVVLIAWGVSAAVRHARTDQVDGLALPAIDTAAVDTMAFMGRTDTTVVARSPDGRWSVNGHPASASTVTSALQALVDTSTWSELAARSSSAHTAMGVTADSGTLVHVGVRNGAGFTLIAGHHTSTFGGVFVRRPADSAVYALHGPLTQVFDRTAEAWRDRTIASVIPDSVARIEIRRGKASYALVRSGRKWLTPSGAAADSNAVRDFLTRFSPLEAIGFATAAQADSLDFRRPFAEVRLFTGSGGKPSVLLRVDSAASGVWLRPDSSSTIYGIESWNLAGVVPTAKSLLHEPPKAR